jgi:hypothetical protein
LSRRGHDLPIYPRRSFPRRCGPQAVCLGRLPCGERVIDERRGQPLEGEKLRLGSEELLPFKLKLAGMCFSGFLEKNSLSRITNIGNGNRVTGDSHI